MIKQHILAMTLLAALLGTAHAIPVVSTGSGTAVTSIDATADFESQAALYDSLYIENGLAFSRTGLSYNNNGCGYAGCTGHAAFAGFTGNYMYGVGTGGYFDIETAGSDIFYGLEMVVGTGYADTNVTVSWTTFLDGVQTSAGTYDILAGSVFAIADSGGFDMLRFTELPNAAPAFDTVKAQFAQVSEPGTAILFILGLAGVLSTRKKKNV